jgi:23S rRNA pseudouridine2605 synthase
MNKKSNFRGKPKDERAGKFPKRKFVKDSREKPVELPKQGLPVRLNKFLADAGICSRREADKLIESGVVKINGKVVTQLGTKVAPTDKVQYGGDTLKREKLQYILLNKPKGFITTSDDPQDRKIVMSLVENACTERIYPVGRLDRNTLGLLLFTNDGDLAKKLTHPKHGVKKIYHVFLESPLTKNEMLTLAGGVELEDGRIQPDKIAYVEGENDKRQIGLELHSGKNRIVRRMFEHLGHKVVKLDRVFFAGLTKKDLPRGKWRKLTEKEIGLLKRIS